MAVSRRNFIRAAAAAGTAGVAGTFGLLPAGASPEQIRRDPNAVTVALIGDYGDGSPNERAVARMVESWNPAAVFTMGDNVYSGDGADPYELLERKVVNFYRRFIDAGTFYPSLGNHDWGDPGTPLLWSDGRGGTAGAWHDVFDLPGNGRYYDVRIGPLHAFVLDDYYLEPDGHLIGSVQARWLQQTASASDARFKFVVHHFAPYVSSPAAHKAIRWPFAEWGIHASFSGHWHHYERWSVGGVDYIVNGLGGGPLGSIGAPDPQSLALYAGGHGASRLTVAPTGALMEFVVLDGTVVDSITMPRSDQPAKPESKPVSPEPARLQGGAAPPPVSEHYRTAMGREAIIVRLYLAVFQRQPDEAGFAYWTGLDVSTAAIADHFTASPEFRARYGTLSDDQFVERVYENVMGRPSDRAGLNYWSDLLARGVDRGTVILGFSESAEFRRRSGIPG
ncbi:MAG: DUF4214 domain-containing protein [Acidimicrobiales bacterium]